MFSVCHQLSQDFNGGVIAKMFSISGELQLQLRLLVGSYLLSWFATLFHPGDSAAPGKANNHGDPRCLIVHPDHSDSSKELYMIGTSRKPFMKQSSLEIIVQNRVPMSTPWPGYVWFTGCTSKRIIIGLKMTRKASFVERPAMKQCVCGGYHWS